MKSVDDGYHDDDIVWKNYACEFTGIVNGYLSVLINVHYGTKSTAFYRVYDIALYKKVYRKFADKHIESVLRYFRTNGIWLDYYDYNSLVNIYYFVCEGNMPAERYIIDADTAEIITEEELFGDWRSCISKVYRDIESDDGIRRETVPEDDFSAFSNYTLKTWYWDNARFVPENDRDYAPKGYSEFLSDDEISTLDSIAYVFVLEDKETGDEVYASALIPFDRIPERYFDRETYLDNVRHRAR